MLAYSVLSFLFFGLSVILFNKVGYAEYIYTAFALTIVGGLSEMRRNDFLGLCFGQGQLRKVRVAENILASVPFFAFLLYKQMFLPAILLLTGTMILAVLKFKTSSNFALWTPFSKRPFEFSEGFRNTYYLILPAYCLAFAGVAVGNFNLCVFAILLVFAVTLSYYIKQENEYYVWVYNLNVKQFLFGKLRTALLLSFFLTFPIAFLTAVVFPSHIGILLLLFLAGWAFLVYMILSKYAVYPSELSVAHVVLSALCLLFPFLLILLIPYFFDKSQNRLSSLLK